MADPVQRQTADNTKNVTAENLAESMRKIRLQSVFDNAPTTAVMNRVQGSTDPNTGFRASLTLLGTAVNNGPNGVSGSDDKVVIRFPALPEVVELARSAEYSIVNSQVAPDGLHIYMKTNPLEIPFEFGLSAFDEEYCDQGSMTLLMIAARLHATLLPNFDPQTLMGQSALAFASSGQDVNLAATAFSNLSTPVLCWLDITGSVSNWPGISCYGYVKSVNVRLKGPWLSGGGANNLPSSATYKFTFVVAPGYSNLYQNNSLAMQAPAKHVVKFLFSHYEALAGGNSSFAKNSVGVSGLGLVKQKG